MLILSTVQIINKQYKGFKVYSKNKTILSNQAKMNPSVIQSIEVRFESTGKYRFSPNASIKQNGNNSGKKYRRGKKYAQKVEEERLQKLRRQRRKTEKPSRFTSRRQDMPDIKDDALDNLYYANFLGDKYGDNGAHYNNRLPINLKFCDSMAEYNNDDCYCYGMSLEARERYEAYIDAKREKEAEERRIEEQNFDAMVEYLIDVNAEDKKYFREWHIEAVVANGYSVEQAVEIVNYHELMGFEGLCPEADCDAFYA
jgi:hypothetical protein